MPVTIAVQVVVQRQNVVFDVSDVSVQVPVVAVRVLPTCAVPVSVGIGLAAGGAGLIFALWPRRSRSRCRPGWSP